jgi:hypothetical protein
MTIANWVCAAIEYTNEEGMPVHSDLCPPNCSPNWMEGEEWREFLHATLDNWLDKSGGTGHFVIGGQDLWDALNAWADREMGG